MKTTINSTNVSLHTKRVLTLLLCALFSLAQPTFSQDDNGWGVEEDDPLMMYGDEDVLSIATGFSQPIAKAPSVATVITARQIKEAGATTLREVLESVPGLHISKYPHGRNPIYTFRGIYAGNNAQVLIMVNGIPINTLYLGSDGQISGFLPVEMIARIEVIRGPGSAIYGADAVAGVINIVTKSTDDWRGTEIGTRVGSYDTKKVWVTHGEQKGNYDLSIFLSAETSDGHKGTLQADAQTARDTKDGTNVSYAPGPVNTPHRSINFRTDLSRNNWRARLGIERLSNVGSYITAGEALDPTDRWVSDKTNADVTWHNRELFEHIDLKASASYYSTSQEIDGNQYMHNFSPGAKFAGFIIPDGIIGNPQYKDRYGRLSFNVAYDGIESHKLSLGMGYNKGEIHEVIQTKNFGIHPTTGLFTIPTTQNSPVFSVTDYSNLVYMDEGARHNRYLYLQDIWSFLHDWELTAGIRADHYSDYGSTYNPRVALVWAAQFDLNVKLLYGRAFRGPSFGETLAKNNVFVLGNKELDPETIATWELAFDYMPIDAPHWQLSFFRYDWDQIIQLVETGVVILGNKQKQFQNFGNQTGIGMELAVEWEVSRDIELQGNYSLQQSKNVTAATDSGGAPHWQLYLRADWQFKEDWHFNTQLNVVSNRRRAPIQTETREPLSGFTTVDITLRRTHLPNNWEVAASVRNLFDDDVFEPSVESPESFPNDLPMAGRSGYIEARYNFQ